MPRIIIKKALSTEKSYKNQDIGIYSFIVPNDANKIEIKEAVEKLFGVKVDNVNTVRQRPKIRQLRGSRTHTKRFAQKIARISLKDKKAKLDFTKLKSK